MIKNYFLTAWRNLVHNKVYSLINIVGLSLGLTCALLILLYAKDELSYDRFHESGANIYRIVNRRINPDGSLDGTGGNTGYLQGPAFKAAIPEIRSYARLICRFRNVKLGSEVVTRRVFFADTAFFSVFSFPLLSGNPATALQQPNSVVISEKMAKEQFGSSDAMGKILFFNDGGSDKFVPFVVTGIAKKCPQNSSIKFDILAPMEVDPGNVSWNAYFLNSFVVLAPDANPKIVEARMQKVYETDAKDAIKEMADKFNYKVKVIHLLQPFRELHLSKDYAADNGLSDASNPLYSYILSGVACFILLIACINFVNLTIARSIKRGKEIGIRKVVGGNKNQLIAQFLGESFFLCFAAFLLAIVIVQAILPLFNQLVGKALSLSLLLNGKLVIGALVLFIVTGLLAGFYPALVLSNFNPVQTLYNRFALAGKNLLQKGLVVFQFALATLLVVATITIYSQFNYLIRKDLGYDDTNVAIVQKPGMKQSEERLLKAELLKSPDIVAVTGKNEGREGRMAKVNGGTQFMFDNETIDESYLPLYKIPIVKGRNFSPDFPGDSAHSVIVNESFVKQAGWKEPIGQQVNVLGDKDEKYTVIGVVKDYHFLSLTQEINPQVFTMKPGNEYGMAVIRIRPHSATASLQYIQKTFSGLFPVTPYTYIFKDLENREQYEAEAKWKQMMLFGAVFTVFISCIGLFGLSVLSAERRVKEIGIRKVLGASVNGVVMILSRDFLKLVIIALLVAIPVSWLAAYKWLEHYPYRITLSWWLFAGAGILVVVLALATVSFQAIRAAVANPVKSLRAE